HDSEQRDILGHAPERIAVAVLTLPKLIDGHQKPRPVQVHVDGGQVEKSDGSLPGGQHKVRALPAVAARNKAILLTRPPSAPGATVGGFAAFGLAPRPVTNQPRPIMRSFPAPVVFRLPVLCLAFVFASLPARAVEEP